MSPKIRVLVVDDSAFARKVMREVLSRNHGIEVVGTARDGLEALERVTELRPDVVTLDLVMPNLDGLGFLRALPPFGAPRVIVVSVSDGNSEIGIEALHAGAVDLVRKPTALATDGLYDVENELVAKVRAAAASQPQRRSVQPYAPLFSPLALSAAQTRLIVIGTSTGGPNALTQLLTALPRDLPVPIAIALHIPVGYTEALARRLDDACAISVMEAGDSTELRPGLAVLARGGLHLKVRKDGARGFAYLSSVPTTTAHFPAVNVLFESAAREYGSGVLAVVLTGMGDDGLEGARAVHAAGGTVLTEAEASCIVYGMPRCVREAGLAAAEARIEDMSAAVLGHVHSRPVES